MNARYWLALRRKPGMFPALLALWGLLALPPVRYWLEASMTRHMIVQMPLLVAIGSVLAHSLSRQQRCRIVAAAGGPLALLTLASFASTYWMMPRALDLAVASGAADAVKFVTLPLLVGLPLALAWRPLGVLGRGFVWTNLISMLVFIGWLYIAAPLRVCNSYLVDDQARAGWWMVYAAAGIFATWLGALFVGKPPATVDTPCAAGYPAI